MQDSAFEHVTVETRGLVRSPLHDSHEYCISFEYPPHEQTTRPMSMIIDAITKALNDAYGEEKRPGIPITKGPQMLGSPLNPRAYKLNLVGILPNDADAACEAFGIVWQAVVDVVGADKCVVSTRVRG